MLPRGDFQMSPQFRQGKNEPLQVAFTRDFKHAQQEHGESAAGIASHFGKGQDWLYKLCHGEGAMIGWFQAIATWSRVTGSVEALRWLARECGCVLIVEPEVGEVHQDLSRLSEEFSDVVRRYGVAFADGKLSPEEQSQVERELDELIGAACAIKAGLSKRANRGGRAASLRDAS